MEIFNLFIFINFQTCRYRTVSVGKKNISLFSKFKEFNKNIYNFLKIIFNCQTFVPDNLEK